MVWGMIQRHRIQRVAGEITGYLGYLSQRRRDGSLNGSLPYYHYRPLYRYWLEWQALNLGRSQGGICIHPGIVSEYFEIPTPKFGIMVWMPMVGGLMGDG